LNAGLKLEKNFAVPAGKMRYQHEPQVAAAPKRGIEGQFFFVDKPWINKPWILACKVH
jgi:hypothetical protein